MVAWGEERPDPQDDRDALYTREALRERLFWEFECTCREIAKEHGWGAVVRAVGRALEDQLELAPK